MSIGAACRLSVALAVGLLCALGAASPASAVLTFDLDTVFSGATPDGPSPWLSITFTDRDDLDGVTVTFAWNATTVAGQFVTEWDFNTDLTLPLDFDFQSSTDGDIGEGVGQALPTITQGANCCQADGDGLFDIEFQFPSAGGDRFDTGQVVYLIECGDACSDANFNFVSASGGGAGTFHSAAHIQGIPQNGCSGWVGDGNGNLQTGVDTCGRSVAEPSALLTTGLGLAGVGLVWRRLRRR